MFATGQTAWSKIDPAFPGPCHSRRLSAFWRKHHLGYDQTKYVVERVRRRLALEPAYTRKRTVSRPDQSEVERLVQTT
jgi:integrase/recombinase XerD